MSSFLKLLFFASLLTASSYFFVYAFGTILANPTFLLQLSWEGYRPLVFLILSFYLLSTSFALLVTISPAVYSKIFVYCIASITPFFILPGIELKTLTSVTLFLIFLFGSLEVRNHLRSYFHFNPRIIFSSSLHFFLTLLAIFCAIAYFFSYKSYLADNGFSLPQDFIDVISKTSAQQLSTQLGIDPQTGGNGVVGLSQAGLNKADITSINDHSPLVDPEKQKEMQDGQIRQNIKNAIEPYLKYLPYGAALLFFLSLQSLVGLSFFILPMFLTALFALFEKIGLVKFEMQTQQVKKLVVRAEKANILSEEDITDRQLKEKSMPI